MAQSPLQAVRQSAKLLQSFRPLEDLRQIPDTAPNSCRPQALRLRLDTTRSPRYVEAMVSAPGRVNLIGEHIDYHGLPVLPIALQRSIRVRFDARSDRQIRATSAAYGHREFTWTPGLTPVARGDWENYLRAAAQAIAGKWGVMNGIDATIESDLPPAAGLSSSSALIVASHPRAAPRQPSRGHSSRELMEILPDGEQFVGTRGGGMDHAASLASREGHASLIEFAPLAVHHIPIPPGLGLSGGQQPAHRREIGRGARALQRGPHRGQRRRCARRASRPIPMPSPAEPKTNSARSRPRKHLPPAFLHVVTEAFRVRRAVGAMHDATTPLASAASCWIPTPACAIACRSVAPHWTVWWTPPWIPARSGARLTGAGFGGCAVVFCRRADLAKVRDGLAERFYSGCADHILHRRSGAAALYTRSSYAASYTRLDHRVPVGRHLLRARALLRKALRKKHGRVLRLGPFGPVVAGRHLDGGHHVFQRYAESGRQLRPHAGGRRQLAVVGLHPHRRFDGVLLRAPVAPLRRAHRSGILRAALLRKGGQRRARLPRRLPGPLLQLHHHGHGQSGRLQDRRHPVRAGALADAARGRPAQRHLRHLLGTVGSAGHRHDPVLHQDVGGDRGGLFCGHPCRRSAA